MDQKDNNHELRCGGYRLNNVWGSLLALPSGNRAEEELSCPTIQFQKKANDGC